MARIIADKGSQRTVEGYFRILEMDCGCEVRISERWWLSGTRASGVDLRDRLGRVADAHDCDVIVHHATEGRRREVRQFRRTDQPIRYMGVDVSSHLESVWLRDPRLAAPEQEVRRAAEQLRGLQASSVSVVVDESRNIGQPLPADFKVQSKAEPPKKQEDQHRDRFELIELD